MRIAIARLVATVRQFINQFSAQQLGALPRQAV